MGRAKVIGIVCVVLAMLAPLTFALFTFVKPSEDCDGLGASANVSLSAEGLTVKGVKMNPDQRAIAEQIAGIVAERRKDFPDEVQERVTVIALITAIVESTIQNLDYGDSDSAGVFQQRPSQGWGTFEEVTNVRYATNKFLDVLLTVDGWKTKPYGDVAQSVQRSAYPERYAEVIPEGEAIYNSLVLDTSETQTFNSDTCTAEEIARQRLEVAVLAALAEVGSSYTWDDAKAHDGASFVSAMFAKTNVELPDTLSELVAYEGDADAGVRATWVSAADIKSGSNNLERGDVLFWSDNKDKTERSDATRTGIYIGPSTGALRIATYNVLGSSHTVGQGPEEAGVERIEEAYDLITTKGFTVVGLQELQPDQRRKLVNLLGSGYGIFPKMDMDYSGPGSMPANSIIWDKSQVELVKGGSLKMPYYFNERRRDIPLVKLRHITSQQEFYVANTHDPAGFEYAKLRKLNADQHAQDMDELAVEGLPLFFTGDFNSGFGLRTGERKGNRTYQNKRENLTWCIMTASGTMMNAYDASRVPPRTGPCPQKTTDERGIGVVDHIYVSKDVRVTDYQVIENRNVTESDHPVVYIDAGTDKTAEGTNPGALGTYVGPHPDTGDISLLTVRQPQFVGAMRFTFSGPEFGASGEWTLPMKYDYTLTAAFGQCGIYWSSCHTGQDFAAPEGTPVLSVTGGKIVTAGWTDDAEWAGNHIVVELSNGNRIWYCHLSEIALKSGAVGTGTIIGYVGNTGNTSKDANGNGGYHLHLEVRLADGTPVDPMQVLRDHGLSP